MKTYCIQRSSLKGVLSVPPSKSQTMRALLFAAMAQGVSTIREPLLSPDIEAMIKALRFLGAEICRKDSATLFVQGVAGRPFSREGVIDCSNSGQVLRFVGALCSLTGVRTVLTGDSSLCTRRPVQPLLNALRELGAFANSTQGNGHAPIEIKGPLSSGECFLEGQDSQPVSALLMLAPFLEGTTQIFVEDPGELPWIDLTLSWLDRLGIPYENRGYTHYTVEGGQKFSGFDYTVPGDFSSAAFPLSAALVTDSQLRIENIDLQDSQGDKKILRILSDMGARIEVFPNAIEVAKGSCLQGRDIDCNEIIDALPILAVIACFSKGTTRLFNAKIARKKECDRIFATARELKNLGACIIEHEDGLSIHQAPLVGARVETYRDHRMVMALTVAGMAAQGKTYVTGAEAADKSYPCFFEEMQRLGGEIGI